MIKLTEDVETAIATMTRRIQTLEASNAAYREEADRMRRVLSRQIATWRGRGNDFSHAASELLRAIDAITDEENSVASGD